MLRLYYADVSGLSPDGPWEGFTDYRREKLATLRVPEKRRQSIGAELLLRAALADCAPDHPWPPEIRAGENGKPEWNVEGLYFSLSHSGRIAACAVADRPLGLDLQKPAPYREALARRFFAPEEQAFLLASADRDRDFCRIWTMKEARIKALGTGLRTELSSFSVVGEGREKLCAAFWQTELAGYCFALCLPGAASAEPDAIIEKQLP